MGTLSHLDELEAEAIYIIREVAAECEKPVMLYSIGKDSSVMLHLALKAFYPEKPPFPFLHVNTTWKFKEMIEFRDKTAKKYGLDMIEYINEEGVKKGINPFDHGSAYTDIMKTQALKQALDKYGFTAAFGGGRRDEEKSRAKERILSFRNAQHAWDPKNQRPEMWKLFNTKIQKGEVHYDFVEVMACRRGCIMGGGQPVPAGPRSRIARSKGLYDTDINTQIKKSNENPLILSLYDELLKGKTHELLHRNFEAAKK